MTMESALFAIEMKFYSTGAYCIGDNITDVLVALLLIALVLIALVLTALVHIASVLNALMLIALVMSISGADFMSDNISWSNLRPALFYALLSQKLALAGENSTDMSAASPAFCISVQHHNNRKTMLLCCYDYFVGVSSCCCLQMPLALGQPGISVRYWHQHANAPSANHAYRLCSKICGFLVLVFALISMPVQIHTL